MLEAICGASDLLVGGAPTFAATVAGAGANQDQVVLMRSSASAHGLTTADDDIHGADTTRDDGGLPCEEDSDNDGDDKDGPGLDDDDGDDDDYGEDEDDDASSGRTPRAALPDLVHEGKVSLRIAIFLSEPHVSLHSAR